MAMRKTGTILVLQGYNEYISNMIRASQSETKLGEEATKAGRGLDAMTTKSIAAGTTIGNLLAGAIQKTIGLMRGMGQEVIGTVASYERLSMSMTSLVAKEMLTTGAVENMTDALAEAGPKAQELLGWIQDLAIKSPFDQEGVAQALRTAMAYGFTTAEAQRLTAATIDFTTATGAQSYVMDQVALALGQIKAKGKLAGQEMLQLVNAGFNVNAVLKDMGYTMNDVSAGLVSADEFILKFTESIERDFGGAAARSSETLGGLLNTMGDIRQMGIRALFTPAIQAALPYLAAFATKLQEMIPAAQMVGQYIGKFTQFLIDNRGEIGRMIAAVGVGVGAFLLITNATAIWGAVTATVTAIVAGLGAAIAFLLSPIGLIATAVAGLAALFVFSFTDIRNKTGDFFSGMGSDLFEFGHNMIIMLAEGMAKALIAVIEVLTQIGNTIAYWLSPGSPPRLLPHIDQWGTDAMQEFIGGMGSADFSVFQDVSRTIESYIRGMGDQIGETNVIPAILAARSAVMDALQQSSGTGQVGEDAFQNIFRAMQVVNPAMQQYIRSLFEVQAAQKKLNDITQHYDDMLNPMYAELNAISKRRQEVVDDQRKAELESILAEARRNNDPLAEELALMELREIELKKGIAATEEQKATAVDAATAELDAAQEKLDIQKSLIDAQMENNNLLREQADLLKSLMSSGGGGGGVGGGMKSLADSLGGGGLGIPQPPDIEPLDILGPLQEKLETLWGELSAPFAGIGEKLNTLRDSWSSAFIAMGTAVSDFYYTYVQPITQPVIDWLQTNIPAALAVAKAWWVDDAWPAISMATREAWATLQEVWVYVSNWLTTELPARLMYAKNWWINTWSDIKERVAFFIEGIRLAIATKIEALAAKMGIDLGAMKVRWSAIFNDLWAIARNIWTRISSYISLYLTNIKTFTSENLEEIKLFFSVVFGTIYGAVRDKMIEIYNSIKEPMEDAKAFIEGLIEPFLNIGRNIMNALRDGVLQVAGDLIESITGTIEDAIGQAKALLGIDSPSKVFIDFGQNVTKGLAIGLRDTGPITQAIDYMMAGLTGLTPPEAVYPTAAPSQSYGGTSNTYNQQQIQGIGTVTAAQPMDLATIELIVERVIARGLGRG